MDARQRETDVRHRGKVRACNRYHTWEIICSRISKYLKYSKSFVRVQLVIWQSKHSDNSFVEEIYRHFGKCSARTSFSNIVLLASNTNQIYMKYSANTFFLLVLFSCLFAAHTLTSVVGLTKTCCPVRREVNKGYRTFLGTFEMMF